MTWQLKVHPLACIAVGALTGVAVIFAVVHLYDGHDFINSANDLTSRPTPSSRRRRLRISNERQHNTTPSSYSAPDEARRRRHQRRVEILIEEPEERIDDSAWQEDEQWEEEDSHTEAQERAEAQEEDAEEDEEEEEEEEEEEALPVSLFKEWSEDNNKNLLHLLHAISDSQSRKGGITCNKCNMSPVRGIRFKCANCIDFDLCEMCEGSNTHTNTHVFLKLRIPIPPLANPRSALLPSFYPGKATSRSTLSHDKIRELQSRSHFDKVELEALYEQFKSLATVEKTELGIDFETFERCLGPLGLEKNLITERIYAFFDQDKDGTINFGEMVSGFSVLCKGNFDEKIEYAFKGYDMDEDGYISREELYRMFKAYFYLSMELVRDVVSAMEDEMMDTFEFSPSAPVSSAFNVSIPTPASDHENEHATDPNQHSAIQQRTSSLKNNMQKKTVGWST
ncbi:hypothetical protein BDF14DRAFT_1741027 [Spinellus fusiger]|nr:hypothetical protein BDF14DRAFT_1741027 [Spinellus fusiger]